MKQLWLILLFNFIIVSGLIGQNNKGIHFQGIARNENGIIIPNKQIAIRISIINDSVTGLVAYQEIKSIITNVLGLFFINIGEDEMGKVVTLGSFNQIKWTAKSYYLQVEIDPNNSLSFIHAGVEKINYVPLALYAEKASMVEHIIPIELGGTGVETVKELSKLLNIDRINNTPDSIKPLSINMNLALNEKLNKVDTLKMSNRINLKLNAADTNYLSNRINSKMNIGALNYNDIIGGLGFVPVKNVFGLFYDSTKQITTINTATAVKIAFQPFTNKITITNNSTGNPTRITVGEQGVFQINYQLQFIKSDAGNDEVSIWIRRNSSAYPNTNAVYTLQGTGVKNIFTGQYFIELGLNDYIEIYYSVKNINTVLYGSPATTSTPSRPATPSAYITMHSIN